VRGLTLTAIAVSVLAAPAWGTSSTLLSARWVDGIARISGRPVSVRCGVVDGGYIVPLGHADRARRLIEVQPFVCNRLNAFLVREAPAYSQASFATAQALLILVHESVHLSSYSGNGDEALTECRAIQLIRTTALALGVPDTLARALGHEALRFDARLPGPDDWRVQMRELPSYRSPECYDGGPLDIDPASSDWPN
jgi:hypothetical protein